MDDDTDQAAWAQQEQDERHRRQEEISQWAQESKLEFQRQIDEWQNDFNERQRRIQNGNYSER